MKKRIQKIMITIFIIVSANQLIAQNLYELNLMPMSNNFIVDCGQVTPAHWMVNTYECNLVTEEIFYPLHTDDSAFVAPVSVTIHSLGNMVCSASHIDGVMVRTSVNNGPWFLQSRITPCSFSSGNVTTTFKQFAPAGASIRIMVTLVLDGRNGVRLLVKNGNISIGIPLVANETNWVKRTTNNNEESVEHESSCSFSFSNILMEGNWTNTNHTTEKSEKQNPFELFPNPAKIGNPINVEFHGIKKDGLQLKLIDFSGKECYLNILTTGLSGSGNFTINTSNLEPGIYMLIGSGNNKGYKQTLILN